MSGNARNPEDIDIGVDEDDVLELGVNAERNQCRLSCPPVVKRRRLVALQYCQEFATNGTVGVDLIDEAGHGVVQPSARGNH